MCYRSLNLRVLELGTLGHIVVTAFFLFPFLFYEGAVTTLCPMVRREWKRKSFVTAGKTWLMDRKEEKVVHQSWSFYPAVQTVAKTLILTL